MIALPLAAEPPQLLAPAPYQVSFGRVEAIVPAGTVRIQVRVDGELVLERAVRRRHVRASIDLPARDVTVRLVGIDTLGARSAAAAAHVFGLPRRAAPRAAPSRLDASLQRRLRALARAFGATAAFYVRDLGSGAGAAWNARARVPAASTLKLAIAVEALRSLAGPPAPGSPLDSLLRRVVVDSSNRAANELELLLGGSTGAASARVNALMRGLGLMDSEMYGGYLLEEGERRLAAALAPIPTRVDEQPAFGLGKYTTAFDMARLAGFVHLAAGALGPLSRVGGFTAAEARYLLYLMLHSGDRGKLDRHVAPSAVVAHKAGWIATSRHDVGVVYHPDGAFVAAVMTYRAGGVGDSSDELAGRIAQATLARLRASASAQHPRRTRS